MASLVAFATSGCKGEEALFARDAAVFSGLGGGGLVTGSGGTGKGGASGQGGAATGGAGAAGMAGGGAAGQGTGGQPITGKYGDSCQSSADCNQGTCRSNFCCDVDCPGSCQTCDSSGKACVDVMHGLDPRGDCPDKGATSCLSNGTGCSGSGGACIVYPAGTSCSSTSMCSGTGSVIDGSICDGQGHCNPNTPVSCNGFLCQSNACLTSCTAETDCVQNGFCGAKNCVGPIPNLAGNGDGEYGTQDGWSPIQGGAVKATNTVARNGTFSIEETGRTAAFQGPGYYIPTGQGAYNVSLWAMQNQYAAENPDASVPTPPTGLLQLHIYCKSADYYLQFITNPLPKGVWVNFSFTFDTYNDPMVGLDCYPDGKGKAAPGLVKSAAIFLQDIQGETLVPNLYVDDLVVTVTDSHNLVGNPTFESGNVDGWSLGGVGSASLGVSTAYANTLTHSLSETNRTTPTVGIRYALPIGAANYAVSLYAMQSGMNHHPLQLQAAYTCLGDTTVHQDTIVQTGIPGPIGGAWVLLSGHYAFPPLNAPANCKQLTGAAFWVTQGESGSCGTGAGQIECPDLFVDDATITLTNMPPQ